MPNVPSMLIQCPSCGREISCNAASCPQCGAPNSWVHPKIREIKEKLKLLELSTPFELEAKGTILSGHTAPTDPWMAFGILAGCIGVVCLMLGFIWDVFLMGTLICTVISAISTVLSLFGGHGKKSFQADFSGAIPSWNSDDDTFWSPVKSVVLGMSETST